MSTLTRHGLYRLWGFLAEFETPERLIEASRQAHKAGYRAIEAYSPFPLEELPDALGIKQTRLPWAVLAGGIMGALTAFLTQYYSSVIDYPHNIGGRPFNSWPSFIPVTFELAVLLAALSGLAALIALNRLPRPHHPVFGEPRFRRATRDRFFLCIESRDKQFDTTKTREFLSSLSPLSISEVQDDTTPRGAS